LVLRQKSSFQVRSESKASGLSSTKAEKRLTSGLTQKGFVT